MDSISKFFMLFDENFYWFSLVHFTNKNFLLLYYGLVQIVELKKNGNISFVSWMCRRAWWRMSDEFSCPLRTWSIISRNRKQVFIALLLFLKFQTNSRCSICRLFRTIFTLTWGCTCRDERLSWGSGDTASVGEETFDGGESISTTTTPPSPSQGSP